MRSIFSGSFAKLGSLINEYPRRALLVVVVFASTAIYTSYLYLNLVTAPSIAAMVALGSTSSKYSEIDVISYWGDGKGGGGRFEYHASASPPVTDGHCIYFPVSGGYWQRISRTPYLSVEDCGAKGDGSTNDAIALNAAFAIGGQVYLGSHNYKSTTPLTINVPVRITGTDNADGTAGTILTITAATNADKILVGDGITQLYGVQFEHLTIATPNATGGAIVFYNYVGDSGMDDIRVRDIAASAIGVKITYSNTLSFAHMRMSGPTQAGWYIYGDDTHRSDVIIFNAVNVTGDSLTTHTHIPNAIELDGFVNTIQGQQLNFVDVGRGIYAHNSVGATQRGEFITTQEMDVDFPYYEGVRLEYHDGAYFLNSYIHGSIQADNIYIEANSPQTTSNIQFIGGNCTGAYKRCAYLNGRYQRIIGMDIGNNSGQSSGMWSGVEIGPDSIGTIVTGNFIGANTGLFGATQDYGITVDVGAVEYSTSGNSLTGNITGPLLDLEAAAGGDIIDTSNSANAPNIGQIGLQGFKVDAPVSGFTITFDDYQALHLLPAATLATGTIVMPPHPVTGQVAQVFTTQEITALTVSPNSGQTISAGSGPTTLLANTGFALKYDAGTAAWYRVQ